MHFCNKKKPPKNVFALIKVIFVGILCWDFFRDYVVGSRSAFTRAVANIDFQVLVRDG